MSNLNIFIDADSIVVRAALAAQTNFCLYQDGRRIKPIKSKLQWTKDNPKLNPDSYQFVKEATLNNSRGKPVIDICKYSIRKAIKDIEKAYPDRKSWVCIEADGNHRDDLYPDYKGTRSGEILLRGELSSWVKEVFPRVVLAFGCETDDRVAQYMWKGHQDFLATGVYTNIAASLDKDLRTVAGVLYNYDTRVETVITELDADRWFCTQILMGDAVDNIKGINGALPKELTEKYGVRANSRGVGERTAEAILSSCRTSRECFERLIECYKAVHDDEWLPKLQLEAVALRMQHTKGELYNIADHFRHLGIQFTDTNPDPWREYREGRTVGTQNA